MAYRGKDIDQSTPWSDWTLEPNGSYYYTQHQGPTGLVEYDYANLDGSPRAGPHPHTPRFTGTDTNPTTAPGSGGSSNAFNTGQYYNQGHEYTGAAETGTSSNYILGSPDPQNQSIFPTIQQYNKVAGWGADTSTISAQSGPSGYLAPQSEYPYGGSVHGSGTSTAGKLLDSRYQTIPDKELDSFFRLGRVFMVPWVEPARAHQGGPTAGSQCSRVWLDDVYAFAEIRRFVVVKAGHGNCLCSPIHTYGGQATLKKKLPDTGKHAIIYTSDDCPGEFSIKTKDERTLVERLRYDPIRVISEQTGQAGTLEPTSRLNYSKIYCIEYYMRVLNIGMVHRDSLSSLRRNAEVTSDESEKSTRGGSGDKKHHSKGHASGSKNHHKRSGK